MQTRKKQQKKWQSFVDFTKKESWQIPWDKLFQNYINRIKFTKISSESQKVRLFEKCVKKLLQGYVREEVKLSVKNEGLWDKTKLYELLSFEYFQPEREQESFVIFTVLLQNCFKLISMQIFIY